MNVTKEQIEALMEATWKEAIAACAEGARNAADKVDNPMADEALRAFAKAIEDTERNG